MTMDIVLLLFFTMGSKIIVFAGLVTWLEHKTRLEEAREQEEAWDSGWSTRLDDPRWSPQRDDRERAG